MAALTQSVGSNKKIESQYFTNRENWRHWLEINFETQDDVWLEYPLKRTGKKRILYNDAVEEALCFGWIDTTIKSLNEETSIQRFCKRRKNSSFSQPNIERLKWLYENNLVHKSISNEAFKIINQEFIFPEDIIQQLKADKAVWKHYQNFSAPYKRIRIAYIESARKKPEEFEKRLNNFINKTKENKLIKGFGGIEKYY
nr:YdeI/OmpD-associated family protein [uncultured Carboxylicivirga sp.]